MRAHSSGVGDVFTVQEFANALAYNTINSFDGYGYFSFDGGKEEEPLTCYIDSFVKAVEKKGYKFVIWYNK